MDKGSLNSKSGKAFVWAPLNSIFVGSVVQLTGLVGSKICDVHVITVSDVSEKFWKCGSTESLMIPKIIFF